MRSLPRIVSQIPNDLRNFLDRVREYMSEGGEERFVTLRELRTGGIVSTTPNGTVTEPEITDAEKPNMPTGLTASGVLGGVILNWDAPTYQGHSYTEILASVTNSVGAAEVVGTSNGVTYTHSLGSGATRYYWIRFINKYGVAGPYNSNTGTVGIVSTDPAYLLDVLAGSITDAELSTALNTQIDTNTTQITDVRNLYTVKMDNQGYLTGFGLMSTLSEGGVPTTDFFVNANRFAVTTPTTSIPARTNSTSYSVGAFVGVASSTSKMLVCKVAGVSSTSAPNISATAIGTLVVDGGVTWQVASRVPLSVLTTSATINGVSVSPGVYIDGASIVNATITNAAIGNAAITDAKINDLAANKITAGNIQTGYIRSTVYTAGSSGWSINADGTAEFAQATIRGSIFGGSATAYATGTGLFSGLDSAVYKFRVGNPSGNQFTWDGSALTVTGTISGGTILGGSASTYTAGTGLFSGLDSSIYKWRVGNPTGARIQWDGSAIYVYNSNNQVTIASGDIDYSVITGTKPTATATTNAIYRQATAPAAPVASASVTTLTRSTTTATATTSVAHGLSVGSIVVISGVTNDIGWNGAYTVTQIVSTTQFRFTVPSTLTTPATGTIVVTPNQRAVNDIWFDTSNAATYYFNGTSWALAGDRTSVNTAAAISGQGDFATLSSITPTNASNYIAGLALNTPQFASEATFKTYSSGFTTTTLSPNLDAEILCAVTWTTPTLAQLGGASTVDVVIIFSADAFNITATAYTLGLIFEGGPTTNDYFLVNMPARITGYGTKYLFNSYPTGMSDTVIARAYMAKNLPLGTTYISSILYSTNTSASANNMALGEVIVHILKK